MTGETRAYDRIEKSVVLNAPLERVWNAVTESRQFGTWFGADIESDFRPGVTVGATMSATQVDEKVAEEQKPYAGLRFVMLIERVEPMRLFSFRWHPHELPAEADPSEEPTTLVSFAFEAVEGGTRLTITESGFEDIPIERRRSAFEANEEGWTVQATLIEKYLSGTG